MIRILAIAVAAALAAAGVQTLRLHSLRSDIAQERAAAAELARTIERQQTRTTQEIDRATQTRTEAAGRLAATARADADGLRDALAAITAGPAPAPGCADVKRERDRMAGLLGEAAGLVAECQERGQRLADTVTGLQDYARRVCAVAELAATEQRRTAAME